MVTSPLIETVLFAFVMWSYPAAAMGATTLNADDAFQETEVQVEQFISSRARSRSQSRLSVQVSHAELRGAVEGQLEIRCEPDRMSVSLRRSPSKPMVDSIIKHGRLTAERTRDTVDGCVSTSNVEREELVLTFGYSECGVKVEMNDGRKRYSIQINVELDNVADDDGRIPLPFRARYAVQCIHPEDDEAVEEPATFTFDLSSSQHSESYWTYPHAMEDNDYVFIGSNASLPWYKNQGVKVYTYPLECWSQREVSSTVQGEDTQLKGRKKYFLKNGCDDHVRGLSQIHYVKGGSNKVSILGSNLLLDDDDEQPLPTSQRSRNVIIGCDMIPCTHSSTIALLNIPKCPPSYYCSDTAGSRNSVLSAQLRLVPRKTVVSGTIIVKGGDDNKGVPLMIACNRCPPTSASIRTSTITGTSTSTERSVTYVDGVAIHVAVYVALAGFTVGMLFMGALWWIHEKTDPNRIVTAQGYGWQQEVDGTDRNGTTSMNRDGKGISFNGLNMESRLHRDNPVSLHSFKQSSRE